MSAETTLARLRRFLFALTVLLYAGTLVELLFTAHTKEPIQFLPFLLCGWGIVITLAALLRPQRNVLVALRVSMILIALGSVIGLYEHITNNIEFYVEIHPAATFVEEVTAALGGANPLVAPGILAVGAVLALAATYAHPALQRAALRAGESRSGEKNRAVGKSPAAR
jgi:hypothetical protein